MKAVINVGLLGFEPAMSVAAKHELVASSVRRMFGQLIDELIDNTSVLVVSTSHTKDHVLHCLYNLCRIYGKSHISILFEDGEGRISGPDSDKFGPFAIEEFVSPSFYNIKKAA